MHAPRHLLLGCKLNGTPENWIRVLVDDFYQVGNFPGLMNRLSVRADSIHCTADLIVMHHLGYKIPIDIEKRLNEGFDVALDYFLGKWWNYDEDDRISMDKTRSDRDLVWFKSFSEGLFLGLLTERWSDIAKLCSWVEIDLEPEYLGGAVEDELVHVYISIASALRPEPLEGLSELEANILKCKRKRPRLLFESWNAARSGDQHAFDRLFKESLKHFDKYNKPSAIRDWIAQHQSVVWMVAKKLGMQLPELPEKLEALIVSRESLGFGEAKE